ncbi:MAG: DUF3108 domain-containing protein [Candidatus Auribacterota bacterium]
MLLRTMFRLIILILLLNPVILTAQEPDNDYLYTPFDRSLIPEGEQLTYQAFILGKLIPMGTAHLSIDKVVHDNEDAYRFRGTAEGGYLIFTVKMLMDSIVNYATLRPIRFIHDQSGFEQRKRILTFDWDSMLIRYSKFDFSDDVLIQRAETPIEPQTRDILSTLYFARSVKPEVGYTVTMKLIEKRDIWKVKIVVVEKGTVKVKDRDVAALKIKLIPDIKQDTQNEVFQGLFGLKGEIILWVSEDRRIPLLIEGDYPLAFFDLKIRVILMEWAPEEIITPVANTPQ